jgi:hypothetical protein
MEVIAFRRQSKELQSRGIVTETDENAKHHEQQQRNQNPAVANWVINREQACKSGEHAERPPGPQYRDKGRIGREVSPEQTLVQASRPSGKEHSGQSGHQMVGRENEQIQIRKSVPEFHSVGMEDCI